MRGFLRTLAAEGRAVLISSHLMSELEDTADHLVIVGRGRVIADTPTRDLLAAASGDRVTLRTGAAAAAMTALQAAGAAVTAAEPGTLNVSGLAAARVVTVLTRRRRAVLRGGRAPCQPGTGLPGAHPRRRRVPRPAIPGAHPMTATAVPPAPRPRGGRGASGGCCTPNGPSSARSAAGSSASSWRHWSWTWSGCSPPAAPASPAVTARAPACAPARPASCRCPPGQVARPCGTLSTSCTSRSPATAASPPG